ncbi:MAG: SDR family oxidoreductase [Actinomycetota bacterium]
MTTWTRALVTGASSGIGRSIAQQLAADGTALVVTARDTDRLQALADELPVDVEVLGADLATKKGRAAVADRIASHDDPIDLLVNNAGLGYAGNLIDLKDADDRRTVDVNVVALHELTRTAAKVLVERGGGAILNVSSIAGDLPGPGSTTYNATKAFVTSLSEGLHAELKGTGVTVTALCPGLTRTEFQERAGIGDMEFPDFLWQSADEVAKVGLDAAKSGKAVVVAGVPNKVWSRVARSMPRGAMRELTRITTSQRGR